MLRVDKGEHAPVESLNIDTLPPLNQYDAIIISDYNKGFISALSVRHIINNFQNPIFVDSKKRDLSIYEDCIIKINEQERQNVELLPNKAEIIVTLGSAGALWNGKKIPHRTCRGI